jgi:hypothetical protein
LGSGYPADNDQTGAAGAADSIFDRSWTMGAAAAAAGIRNAI